MDSFIINIHPEEIENTNSDDDMLDENGAVFMRNSNDPFPGEGTIYVYGVKSRTFE